MKQGPRYPFDTSSFILAKTQKSIRNNFYSVFIQISGKYKKHLTQKAAPSCSKKLHIMIWFWINCHIKFFNAENPLAVFHNQPPKILPIFPVLLQTK